jgi:hypothetical protein
MVTTTRAWPFPFRLGNLQNICVGCMQEKIINWERNYLKKAKKVAGSGAGLK